MGELKKLRTQRGERAELSWPKFFWEQIFSVYIPKRFSESRLGAPYEEYITRKFRPVLQASVVPRPRG
jgi:hypothetical protein